MVGKRNSPEAVFFYFCVWSSPSVPLLVSLLGFSVGNRFRHDVEGEQDPTTTGSGIEGVSPCFSLSQNRETSCEEGF